MRNVIGSLALAVVCAVCWPLAPRARSRVQADGRGQRTQMPSVLSDSAPAPSPTPRPAAASGALRVLFVGNSHTYFNDMPHVIAQLAAAAGEPRRLDAVLEVAGGATLADHLAGRRLQPRLSAGRWDYVVLQDQQQRPTWRMPQLEREFFAPARTLDVLIRAASSRTVLYMTPARQDGDRTNVAGDTFERMQERSRLSHLRLGRELGAVVAPVGMAWAWAHRESPTQPLWAPDRYHPSQQGSYLTACVFYGLFYQRPALGNTFSAGLPAPDAAFLQRAADAALADMR